MSLFEITAVSEKERPFDSKYGAKVGYRVHLRNGDGSEHLNVELVRNASSPKPSLGEQLEGDLEDRGEYGERIRIASRGPGQWGGSRPEDPQRQKRIVRQHSQNMALQAIKLAMDMHLLKAVDPERPQSSGGEPETTAELFALIAKTADWFDKDVESAAS